MEGERKDPSPRTYRVNVISCTQAFSMLPSIYVKRYGNLQGTIFSDIEEKVKSFLNHFSSFSLEFNTKFQP